MENDGFNLQKLRYERMSRQVTQIDVAKALGITVNSYYKRETGKTNITVDELPTIFEAIGIEIEDVAEFY